MGHENTTKTRQQIANEYGIDVRGLRRKLRRHDIKLPKGAVYPADIERIYQILGIPPGLPSPDKKADGRK